MTLPLVLKDALLANGRKVDVHIVDGKIAALPETGAPSIAAAETIALNGALLLPGLVDGHIHLDKTLMGMPFIPHIPGDSVAERVTAEKELRKSLTVPVEQRATKLVEQVVASGTTAMRSHVDIDDLMKLDGLHALLKVREAARHHADIQIVAFPQSGIVTLPGAADMMEQAVREGAELVGGLDPAGFDHDVDGHLNVVFGIAEKHGAGIDIHLHDFGALGCSELRRIAEKTNAAGLGGKVAVSHAYALGGVDDVEFGKTADALAKAGVAIMSNGAGPVSMPPVKRLVEAGVMVFTGSDNIRDAWAPYGNGDMLERAMIVGYRNGLNADADLALALDLATKNATTVMGIKDYGLRVGAPADLVAVDAGSTPEAVVAHPVRRLVVKRGKVVAQNGQLVVPLRL
ncbi:MAG TPA: amidohydrolase family protein [Magnetospirillaceae bacterium]|jgi:cytosine deaminase